MALAELPHLLVLTMLIGSATPMVQRVGRHADNWFLGWIFIALHYTATLFCVGGGVQQQVADLLAVWMLELGGLCFLRAAGNTEVTGTSLIVTIELALPLLAQSALMSSSEALYPERLGAAMLLLAPGLHMVLWPEHRTRMRVRFAAAFAALFPLSVLFLRVDWAVRNAGLLTLLFVGAGILYWVKSSRHTRAVFTASVGLLLWGLSFAAQPLLAHYVPALHIEPTLWLLPQYVVAAGMILALMEEHLALTEGLALHDPLTGLANRRLFESRLALAMTDVSRNNGDRRPPYSVGCVVIDIDNFKTINDSLGHAVGDSLLKALAVRLKWNLGSGDILARTGGDEFTALIPQLSGRDQLQFVAGAMMSASCLPIAVAGHDIDISLSIGVAMFPRDAGDSEALCQAADEAMYRAKRSGGSLLAFAGDDC